MFLLLAGMNMSENKEWRTAWAHKSQHYLQLIIPAALRHKPGSVARGRDRARRVPCDDAAWAPLERRSRDAYHGCAKR